MKASGSYEAYRANNAEYSKKYCLKKTIEFENLKKEDKSLVLEDEIEKARKRHQKSWENKRSKLVVKPPTKPGYSTNQGLSHTTNRIKKVLPPSPGKKKRSDQEPLKTVKYLKRGDHLSPI